MTDETRKNLKSACEMARKLDCDDRQYVLVTVKDLEELVDAEERFSLVQKAICPWAAAGHCSEGTACLLCAANRMVMPVGKETDCGDESKNRQTDSERKT